jgi:hypothetical protein
MLGTVDQGFLHWDDPTTETPRLFDTEVWEIYNTTEDTHPIHLHLVAFEVLNRREFTAVVDEETGVISQIDLLGDGWQAPNPNETGPKDTVHVNPGEVVRIKANFDRLGQYVWHCHILSHEDHEMMRRFEVLPPHGSPGAGPRPESAVGQIGLTNGVLAIGGTSGHDIVEIDQGEENLTIRASFFQHDQVIPLGEVQRIEVRLRRGSDWLDVDSAVLVPVSAWGGMGNDVLLGGGARDELFGGPGADRLDGDEENDRLYGGLGADELYGGGGTNWLRGHGGNDLLVGGPNRDYLYGGAGDDHLIDPSGHLNRLVGGDGNDLLLGGDGDDVMIGQRGNDVIVGRGGDDLIAGNQGLDLLIGSAGADTLYGHAGDDILIAGFTTYDDNEAALLALLTEWVSKTDYATRVGILRSGSTPLGARLKAGETVNNDSERDTMQGGAGIDWFFADLGDAPENDVIQHAADDEFVDLLS